MGLIQQNNAEYPANFCGNIKVVATEPLHK